MENNNEKTNREPCAGFAEAAGSAAKRAREVLLYCKLWTEGDMELPHMRPEKKCLEHRISVIAEAIKQLDALPPNSGMCKTCGGTGRVRFPSA